MTKLNIQIFSDANKNVRKGQVAKKDRSADVKYQLSRFTPAVKDIMEVNYRLQVDMEMTISFSMRLMASLMIKFFNFYQEHVQWFQVEVCVG